MTDHESLTVDLLSREGQGPVWGLASADLNATLLVWPAGHQVPQHTNAERDVLLVVVEGAGLAVVDGRDHLLAVGQVLLVERGTSRSISAGASGIRYLSVHKRRGPLQIENRL